MLGGKEDRGRLGTGSGGGTEGLRRERYKGKRERKEEIRERGEKGAEKDC